MNNPPNVSVIITCHNYADLVENAVKSVLDQDYQNKKIVVINDGSTDNSQEVLENLLQHKINDNGILIGDIQGIPTSIIQNKVAYKQAYARNQGIKLVWNTTDIFAILDADDEYLEGKLSKSVNKILENPDIIGFVYSDLLIHNIDTDVKTHEMRQSYSYNDLMMSCITSNAPLITKKAFETCGLYDIELAPTEDYYVAIKISQRFLMIHIPEPLSLYRVTGRNSTIITPKEVILEKHKLMREKLQGTIPQKYE